MNLTELIIGSLLAVMLLSTAVVFSDNSDAINRGRAGMLCSDIRYVKNCAVSGRSGYKLRFFNDKDGYGYKIRDFNSTKKTVYFPKGIKSRYRKSEIEFRESGSCPDAGTVYIEGPGDINRTITITPPTGRILLKEEK